MAQERILWHRVLLAAATSLLGVGWLAAEFWPSAGGADGVLWLVTFVWLFCAAAAVYATLQRGELSRFDRVLGVLACLITLLGTLPVGLLWLLDSAPSSGRW